MNRNKLISIVLLCLAAIELGFLTWHCMNPAEPYLEYTPLYGILLFAQGYLAAKFDA